MRKHVLLAAVLTSAVVASAVIPAAQAESLKVALPQKGNWDTGIVEFGMKAGIFKEAGIDIEPVYTQGGSATVQAVISGSVDIAMQTGLLGLIGAYAKGAPVRVISTAMTGSPDLYWYARADKGIKSLKDTDGKSVAYSAAGSSSHLIILSLLEQAKSKGKPTATGGIPGTYTQVMSGQIDVGWAVPPFGLEDVKSGKVVIVARGNDVPAIRDETIRVNFANADTLTKKRALLVKFSEAYAKALDWSYRDPKAIAYFAEGAEVTPEIALQARDQFYPKESLQPYEVKGLDLALQQALEYKFIPRAMTEKEVAGLFDILAPKPK
jgi:NitT/TauT family transport system substrate-binding protein